MTIQKAWRGGLQCEGIAGLRVLIAGYSFYYSEGERIHDQMVVDLMSRVIDGDDTHTFWNLIMSYFDFSDRRSFWERVGFIEYVPVAIGNEDHSTDVATSDQISGAANRLFDVMDAQESDLAFVFQRRLPTT